MGEWATVVVMSRALIRGFRGIAETNLRIKRPLGNGRIGKRGRLFVLTHDAEYMQKESEGEE